MSRRDMAATFRERLRILIDRGGGSVAGFARESGVDRSALSQFLDPNADRLPRAETLARIAAARAVTTDWLLGLSNASEGGPQVTSSVEIETAFDDARGSPLDAWRREAVGQKIRYVPAGLPDMLRLPEVTAYEFDVARASARQEHGASLLADAVLRDTDLEIAMSVQALRDLAHGAYIWSDLAAPARRAQIAHIAAVAEAQYPAMRLHLYDGRKVFSAPFTVFGMTRAAIYLGRSYLVVTATEQVRGLARHFDGLVRASLGGPEAVARILAELAGTRR